VALAGAKIPRCRPFAELCDRIDRFLRVGIAGSEFTPLRLLTVITLTSALVWGTRRLTRWLVDSVLAHSGVDVGLREALGIIARYVIISLGALVILQSAGIDLTSLNVLVGAIGVGLGFGLQNIASNFFSGLILLLERPLKIGDRVEIGGVAGEVREIGARATTIVTEVNSMGQSGTGRMIIVPLALLAALAGRLSAHVLITDI
jgi:small-conductance mechanosensitive channel